MTKKFMARVFLPNPGGAYDPAPLHEFDDIESDFVPAIGDVIRYGGSVKTYRDGAGDSYRVVARYFDAATNRCAIYVETWQGEWPQDQ